MKKKILYSLPLPNRETPLNENRWTVEAEYITVGEEKLLAVNCFFKNNLELHYRAFFTKEQYITLDCQADTPVWKTGMLGHYVNYGYWEKGPKGVFVDERYHKTIINFFGYQDKDPMRVISQVQNRILSKKIEDAEKRITDPVDLKMEEVKELPDDFRQWLIDDAFIKSRYIFYQYTSKVNQQGHCTHCKTEMTVYKPKHDKKGICPHCGSSIIYKSIGRSKHITDTRQVACMQKTETGFLIRYYRIRKSYDDNRINTFRKPHFSIYEKGRDFYSNDLKIQTFEYSMFKNKYMRWNKTGENHHRVSSQYNLYPKNVYECIKETKLRFSAIDILSGNKMDFSFDLDGFIYNYKNGCVYLEHFIKVGLFNLTRDCIYRHTNNLIDKDGKSLNKVLGIENDDIKILKAANVTYEGLKLFKNVRESGKRLSTEQLKEIVENYSAERIGKILKHVPIVKALRYLRIQPEYVSDPETIYLDYLESCGKLGYDLNNTFVLFPKDLRAAHDLNVEMINEKANQKTYKQHNSKYAKVKKLSKELNNIYFYEDDKFLIRAPIDAAEIVKEGHSLHHCVGGGGYSERMAKGEIAILFLRDKKAIDTPYYTLEINQTDNRISQCHGYRNKDKDKSRIEPFIKKFKKNILEKSKEKRKAG